ncbi:hypothetical protein J1N35_011828 [Gossypium stocksii]|uniref:Reverse transcriptase domain-containing protein n=1 Tax=Gossypium stocksii TaxID=47602 RepID=A0A9D4ADQ4_9ROSI|nr:hypothetical protein J1N35_011828 [Gossypium stocksii]
MRGAPIGRERLSINHLFFTDACILFGDASSKGASMVRNIIREYELVSGKWVNFNKSLIYFGASVDCNVRDSVTNILGVRVALNLEKYLGLPMMVRRKKGGLLLILLTISKKNRWVEFTWRSICSARDLIAEEILWHLSSGDSVNMWNDLWLLGLGNNRLSVQNINPSWTTVNQLIDAETNTWNRELISRLVEDDQANCIFTIPFANSKTHDLLV